MYSLSIATMARFALVLCVLSILFIGAVANAQEVPPTPSCQAGYALSEDGTQCVATGTVSACPDGFTYDAESNLCTPQSVEHECPSDGSVFNDANGQCEYPNQVPACPPGYLISPGPENENRCIQIVPPFGTDTFTPQCNSEGYSLDEGLHQCVKPSISGCAAGFAYDTEVNLCVSDGSGDVAPSCPSGTPGTVEGDQCTPNSIAPSCPPGYYFDGTTCVEEPTCDAGFHLENHVCVADPVETPSNQNSGGSSNSGGGGGGGSYIPPAATTTATTTPQVLGAATSCYQFTHTLMNGMSGEDVTELQKILIAGGFLVIDAPTGYFGAKTEAAVKAYQASKGLEQVGIVGPKTRALLNACGSTPGGITDAQKAEHIKSLQAQLEVLLKKIAELMATQQTTAAL